MSRDLRTRVRACALEGNTPLERKSLQEIHGILQKTRAEVETKKTELRELVGDHYRSVLESSDHIRAMSDCAVQVAQGAEKLETLISDMRELAAKPPPGEVSEVDPEFGLCERIMELLELPETVRGLVGDQNFLQAADVALVEAPKLQAEVGQVQSEDPLPGFDLQGLIAQQAAAYRSLPRQVAGGCLDAFGAPELTPGAAAEAFVAHLLLDGTSPSHLLRTFVDCRSTLLRDVLESVALGEVGLQQLSAGAMAFEGTVVVASGLCGAGTGGAPPLITGALGRLDTSKEVLKQKAEQVASLFRGTSMAQELAPLGLQFVKTWAPEAAGAKSFAGRFEALIASHNSTSCAQLGELQRLFQRRLDHFRQVLAESMGGDARDWSALWSGACGLFCPGRGVCQDSLSILGRCVEESCARMVRERLGELKLQLPGEDAEDVAELRGQCRARIAQFDEQLGVLLDDVGQISEEIPGSVTLALLQGLEQLLAAALEKLAKREAISQKDALQAALAVEALLSSADSDCNAPTRLGSALKTAASAGPAAVAKKAAIAELLQRRAEEVHYTWARAVVGANEPVASLGSFWKLADDEVGPCCGWGSAKFPAKEGEGKSVAVPIQSSPFVFERLCLAAQSLASAQLQGSAVAAALKAALAECFAAAYEDRPADLGRLKRSGMSHLLQWLFDLNFLRITLSAAAVAGSKPLEHLRDLLAQGEAVAFSDPVDRLLYQDLLKASVNNHVQETKVLLAPFFLQNPLYGFLSQAPVTRSNSKGINAGENEGFELQVSFTAPLRPVLPRFPLLPVAMNVNAMSDLDRRLEPRKAAERPQSLMQQAGGLVGGLGSRIGTGFFGAKGEVLQQRMEAGQGQLRAVQTCWGSRHDLSPLDRSARALRSGTPGAILHKGCRRFRQRGVRRGRPLSGLCEDASQHMVILHVMSPRQRGDGPALHQVPCAPLLLVLGPTSATQEARRQVLRQGWTELARAEGEQASGGREAAGLAGHFFGVRRVPNFMGQRCFASMAGECSQ
ncbi:unnamed protein product [Effrenium voratum]|uniref:Conserved oligomeric Golgi complex subunit 1 n=1 Tax=Effrenium voratum TaxID=2562239 RepID=A0AA36JCA7_9DINO|nr:unnamed protein product [Effrenium voratum]